MLTRRPLKWEAGMKSKAWDIPATKARWKKKRTQFLHCPHYKASVLWAVLRSFHEDNLEAICISCLSNYWRHRCFWLVSSWTVALAGTGTNVWRNHFAMCPEYQFNLLLLIHMQILTSVKPYQLPYIQYLKDKWLHEEKEYNKICTVWINRDTKAREFPCIYNDI